MEFNIYQKTDKHAHFFFNGIAMKKNRDMYKFISVVPIPVLKSWITF